MPHQPEKQKSLLGAGQDAAYVHKSCKALYVILVTVFIFIGSWVLCASISQGRGSDAAWTTHSYQQIGRPIETYALTSFGSKSLPLSHASTFNFARRDTAYRGGFLARSTQTQTPVAETGFFAPADLTPAVDKYARLPLIIVNDGEEVSPTPKSSEAMLTAKSAPPEGPDPFKMVEKELQPLSEYVTSLVKSENPVLEMAASHFFKKRQGKRFRPTIVALIGRALSPQDQPEDVKNRQLKLGLITEMIHVASLIHDDVLDDADTRRGGQAVHTMYTNKVAVLGGDYLLAQASKELARLQHIQVVEVMASALDSLVQGELMQAKTSKDEMLDMDYYMRKSYYKTASLISNACKSTALLAGYAEQEDATIAAEKFGYHLGMAFQIVDDILDFTGASAALGKPAQADMSLGLATAPILFAAEANRDIAPMVQRRFKEPGDIQKVIAMAGATDCVAKSYELAEFHAQSGMDALMRLDVSEARDALVRILHIVLSRKS